MAKPSSSAPRTRTRKDAPGGFSSTNIANRLIINALIPELISKSRQIAADIEPAINAAIDNFFVSLSTHMGTTEELRDRLELGSKMPHWRPLSRKYVIRKGTAQFWLYTMAPDIMGSFGRRYTRDLAFLKSRGIDKVSRIPSMKSFMASNLRNRDPLIQRFQQTRGLSKFGAAEVSVSMPEASRAPAALQTVAELPSLAALAKAPIGSTAPKPQLRSQERVVGKGAGRGRPYVSYDAINVTIEVKLWTAFGPTPKGRKTTATNFLGNIQNIESRLFGRHSLTAKKLIGRSEYHRPLIRPYMMYYGEVVLPQVIRNVLASQYGIPTQGGLPGVSPRVHITKMRR